MYTAKLDDWVPERVTKDKIILWGVIHGDKKGRFKDGTSIHTSAIDFAEGEPMFVQGDIVKTTYSTYLLGERDE